MKRELRHFRIGDSYGGSQDWFRTFMMRIGGCGAETACDSSLYFALHRGISGLYPFDLSALTKEDYVEFGHRMEKYLWPRMRGINRPEIFAEGYRRYLRDCGVTRLSVDTLSGSVPYETAARAVRDRIDDGCPVPVLILNHRDKKLKDYVWHWFLLNGYELPDRARGNMPEKTAVPEKTAAPENTAADPGASGADMYQGMQVKAVTYSSFCWLDLERLWDTGYEEKGGLVLFRAAPVSATCRSIP